MNGREEDVACFEALLGSIVIDEPKRVGALREFVEYHGHVTECGLRPHDRAGRFAVAALRTAQQNRETRRNGSWDRSAG